MRTRLDHKCDIKTAVKFITQQGRKRFDHCRVIQLKATGATVVELRNHAAYCMESLVFTFYPTTSKTPMDNSWSLATFGKRDDDRMLMPLLYHGQMLDMQFYRYADETDSDMDGIELEVNFRTSDGKIKPVHVF